MPFQTLEHIVVFGRACPSLFYHIILGFGRAWKGIEMYIKGHYIILYYIITLKGMPFQTLLDIVMSGRAWPSLLSSYHEGVRKGKEGHLVVV